MDTNADQPQPQSHLFTVRLWREELGDDKTELRGKVQHVLSGETLAFREWADLLAFFQTQTGSSIADEGKKNG